MDKFDYSIDATNVMNLFHDSDFVVYVEGEDDKCFWGNMLELSGLSNYYIEDVGGCENLEPKINQVVNDSAKIIVARDNDYSDFSSSKTNHVQIVNTNGHSIENTLYCPTTINYIIRNMSKTLSNNVSHIEQWFDVFCNDCIDLIHYDIANNIYDKSVSVLGDSCVRLLTSNTSIKLSTSETNKLVASVKPHFKASEINKVKSNVANSNKKLRLIIKGHFLTHAVANIIKHFTKLISNKSITLPNSNLYALCINGCTICKEKCSDIINIMNSLNAAYQAIMI